MSRINSVTVTLEAADEFEGTRDITFPVAATEAEFYAAVMAQWEKWSAILLERAKAAGPANPFDALG